jgi:hypothetical protein
MRAPPAIALLIAAACGPRDEVTPDQGDGPPADSGANLPPEGACGPVHAVDLAIQGVVQDASGLPAPGVEVWLEERAWAPTTVHGQGMTDADGRFTFPATGMPIVEKCWGFAALFYIVAQDLESYGEIDANYPIVSAWLQGESVADFEIRPVVLESDG